MNKHSICVAARALANRSRIPVVGIAAALFVVACGAGGSGSLGSAGNGAGNGTGATSSGTGGSGNHTGSGGSTSSGACDADPAYTAPATTGKWVDATGTLPGVTTIWGVPHHEVLAGVSGRGLYAYSAANNAWTQLKGTAALTVAQVVFDPCHGDRFWMATSGGVYYTEDGDQTAKKLGNLGNISGIGVDLKDTNGKTLIAASPMGWPWGDGKTKLWTSTDGGTTWTDQTAGVVAANGSPFGAVYAVDSKRLVASAMVKGSWDGNNTKGGIWVSNDTGATWAQAPWGVSAYCAGYAWCNYSGWNQPMGEAVVNVDGEIWWVNAWQNTYFSSSDHGATWVDNWGYYDHSAGGGGHAVLVPKKYVSASDSKVTDPNMVWLKHRCNSHTTPCPDTDKQTEVIYYQKNQNGTGMAWWADWLTNPVSYDSATNADQLAYDSAAHALFVSNSKGSGAKQYVWMYAFAN